MTSLTDMLQTYEVGNMTFETIVIPSGIWFDPSIIHNGSYLEYGKEIENSISNPMPHPYYDLGYEVEEICESDLAHGMETILQDDNIIPQSALDSYSDKLISISLAIHRHTHDMFLCPLRGALWATKQLTAMNILGDNLHYLPFTQGSSHKYDAAIIQSFEKILDKAYKDESIFTIGIIDTAIGGHGINALVDLIISVLNKRKIPKTILRVYILHTDRAAISQIKKIHAKKSGNVEIVLELFRVDDLIVEDWDSAFGLKVEYKDNDYIIKKTPISGRLLVLEKNLGARYETDDIPKLTDTLLAKTISDSILSHPRLEFIKDVYHSYLNR